MRYAVILFVGLFLNGCVSTRMIDFTIISSKDTQLKIEESTKGSRSEGRDVAWSFLFFRKMPSMKQAVDNAIEIAGPSYDALIDGVIYSDVSWFVFASRHTFTVVGTPIKTSMLQKGADNASILYHSSLGVSNGKALMNLKTIKVQRQ